MMKKIQHVCRRTPSGVRGLKWDAVEIVVNKCVDCRTPSGVRGLKYKLVASFLGLYESHPVRGAWIEIRYGCDRV